MESRSSTLQGSTHSFVNTSLWLSREGSDVRSKPADWAEWGRCGCRRSPDGIDFGSLWEPGEANESLI